jgi:hypothetical protein
VKPVVHYRNDGSQRIPLGKFAFVRPIDHPNHVPGHNVSNKEMVVTSKVIRIGSNGEFETMNTIYRPDRILHDDDTSSE